MIIEFDLVAIISSSYREELAKLLPEPKRCVVDKEGNSRFIWGLLEYDGSDFEEGLQKAIIKSKSILNKFSNNKLSLNICLWCVVHSDSEFFGFCLDVETSKILAADGIDLVLSIYSDS